MDLSAWRETISRRPNIRSARRNMVESVSGKSIIRPFIGPPGARLADCSRERRRLRGLGTNYPSGISFPTPAHANAKKTAENRTVLCWGTSASFLRRGVCMPRTFLVEEAAALLGVSRRTVYYRIREGKLLTVRTLGG